MNAITDMSPVIIPKSDQINADDMISGPMTYQIEGVKITPGTEQPVNIKLVGEPRFWRPCKSMSRVLVAAWGPDASAYTGRSVTLHRDPAVKWGGMEVGGIRISHMSHIERDMLLQLSVTKGKRAPTVIKPLIAEVTPMRQADDAAAKWARGYIAKVSAATSLDVLNTFANEKSVKLAELQTARPELHTECIHALSMKRDALAFDVEENPATGEGFVDED